MILDRNVQIAVTGHTRGIGKAIYESLSRRGCPLLGLSRATGFDLSQENSRSEAIQAIRDCTVLINNAFCGWGQIELLYAAFAEWSNQARTIVNISSNSGDGNKDYAHSYAVVKTALDKASDQLNNVSGAKCRVINLRPGWVNTDLNRHLNIAEPKMDPEDVAKTVLWVLEQPPLVHVSSLTFVPRPSL